MSLLQTALSRTCLKATPMCIAAMLAVAAILALLPTSAQADLTGYQNSVLGETSLLGYYTFDTASNGAGVVASAVTDVSGNGFTTSTFLVDGTSGSFVGGAPDGSGNGQSYTNNGGSTVFGQPGTSPGWPAAGSGSPYSFFDNTGTASFWFTHTGDGGNKLALGIRESVPGTRYSVHVDGPGNNVGLWNSGAFATVPAGAIDVDDGEWHNLAVVFEDATTVRYVLDGMDLGTTANGLINVDGNIDELGIAGTADTVGGGEAWLGDLDEVAFFEDALSVATIQAQFDAMFAVAAVPEPSSVAIWSLIGIGLVGYGIRSCRR